MSDRPDLRTIATLLIVAKRMSSRPRWLDELVDAVVLPAGPPRNPAALVIGGSDANL
jgi:hypothetical protein